MEPADDAFEQPDAVDDPVEVDAGRDAHAVQRVDDVLGGGHGAGAAVAAVLAAADAAERAVDEEGARFVERAQGCVERGQGHAARVVHVQVEAAHGGPAAADFQQVGFHLVREAEALAVVQADLDQLDAGFGQRFDAAGQHGEAVSLRELAHEVGAPGRADGDPAGAYAARLRVGDRVGPARDDLVERAVHVAAAVDVADVVERMQSSSSSVSGGAKRAAISRALALWTKER